jgi:hypothetical protein
VYRVVKKVELGPGDFFSWQEMGRRISDDRKCQAAGVSVYRDKRDAVHCGEKYPKLGKLIAHGILASEHGKVKPTPSDGGRSHVTWWPYEGVAREASFKVVEEEFFKVVEEE